MVCPNWPSWRCRAAVGWSAVLLISLPIWASPASGQSDDPCVQQVARYTQAENRHQECLAAATRREEDCTDQCSVQLRSCRQAARNRPNAYDRCEYEQHENCVQRCATGSDTCAEPTQTPAFRALEECRQQVIRASDQSHQLRTLRGAQASCDRGELDACRTLGALYERGEGVAQDTDRAAELYQRACDAGNLRSCTSLGDLLDSYEHTPRDLTRAAHLYQRACDGGEMGGCVQLGSLLLHGRGTTADSVRAQELFANACAQDHARGCVLLSTVDSQRRALGIRLRECEGGDADSCFQAGIDSIDRNAQRAESLLRRACDMAHPAACVSLADHTFVTGSQAAAFYQRACDLGGRDGRMGCYRLGHLYDVGTGVSANATRAADLYERACVLGDLNGCYNFGAALAEGVGRRRNFAEARRLFQLGCDQENPPPWFSRADSCASLGTLYENGDGVRRDTERARQLYQIGCDGGATWVCPYLTDL